LSFNRIEQDVTWMQGKHSAVSIQSAQQLRVVSTGILPSKVAVVVFAALEPPVDSN
jgi:hypothetical protein